MSTAIQFTGAPKARKSAVNDHKIAVRNNDSWLIPQRGWNASDEIEQTFAARVDMSTMLDIVRRPIAFGSSIVSSLNNVSKASRTSALFFSCSVWLTENSFIHLSLAHDIRLLRLQHEIVELRHKRSLIRSRVISQWFCPFNQYLLRIRAEHLDRLVDELFQRHCSGFLVAVH